MRWPSGQSTYYTSLRTQVWIPSIHVKLMWECTFGVLSLPQQGVRRAQGDPLKFPGQLTWNTQEQAVKDLASFNGKGEAWCLKLSFHPGHVPTPKCASTHVPARTQKIKKNTVLCKKSNCKKDF